MDSLYTFLDAKLDAIDILVAIDYAANEHKEEIEDLTTETLEGGVDTNGNDLGIYSKGYGLKVKGRLEPVDLKLSGQFHDSMDLKSRGGVLIMENTDPDSEKTEYLYSRYGDDIVGIPKELIESGELGEIMLYSIIE